MNPLKKPIEYSINIATTDLVTVQNALPIIALLDDTRYLTSETVVDVANAISFLLDQSGLLGTSGALEMLEEEIGDDYTYELFALLNKAKQDWLKEKREQLNLET